MDGSCVVDAARWSSDADRSAPDPSWSSAVGRDGDQCTSRCAADVAPSDASRTMASPGTARRSLVAE